ncbi:hypothetical protein PSP6_530066 [Paraburkholderia tropica]|nr:hypothetical protein PSP6_530066 [Paraburkholderia tropica]
MAPSSKTAKFNCILLRRYKYVSLFVVHLHRLSGQNDIFDRLAHPVIRGPCQCVERQ